LTELTPTFTFQAIKSWAADVELDRLFHRLSLPVYIMAHVSPEIALAISRQKARYGRYADTKQWDKFGHDIALPDAIMSYCDTNGEPLVYNNRKLVFNSPVATARFFGEFFAPLQTMHTIAVGDFEQVAPDEVNAVFGFEDQLVSPSLGGLAEIRGGGFYYETWKLHDGQWYIKSLKMQRTYQKESMLAKLGILLWNISIMFSRS
jgi:hypothetical protein